MSLFLLVWVVEVCDFYIGGYLWWVVCLLCLLVYFVGLFVE